MTELAEMSSDPAENLARRFHETYERLAPQYGYETRRESAVPWQQVPGNNRALMVAVAAEILEHRRCLDCGKYLDKETRTP